MDAAQIAVKRFGRMQVVRRVPSEASDAAIFCPMMPALPMPVTITLPSHWNSSFTAWQNDLSSRLESSQIAFASRRRISRSAELFGHGEMMRRSIPPPVCMLAHRTRRP